jgi:hypothetical protein
MSRNYIKDVRRIAKTEELEERLPRGIFVDKPPIPGIRGVGKVDIDEQLQQCTYVISATEGRYDVQDILDGVNEPRAVDRDRNICDKINTIDGMTDCDTGSCMILKPDGFYLPADLI